MPVPQIPATFLTTLLDALEAGYGKYRNPYHNQVHAADVTQTVHCFLLRTGMVVRGRVGGGPTGVPDRGCAQGWCPGVGLAGPGDACCHGDGAT